MGIGAAAGGSFSIDSIEAILWVKDGGARSMREEFRLDSYRASFLGLVI
jgi:hypothetical protein